MPVLWHLLASWLLGALLIQAAAAGPPEAEKKEDKTQQPEEDDFNTTPFTAYGEFNEDIEEAEDTRYFQYGRFYGISLGLGFESVSGNRGLLWQGGFPTIGLKVNYWFDFNVALDLGFTSASHFFDIQADNNLVNISFVRVGLDVKYYFDTKNLSAALSFANPHLLLGFGAFTKSESSNVDESVDVETSVGLSGGFGIEFTIKPRKVYLVFEGKGHFASFKDTFTTRFRSNAGLQDLTGQWFTLMGYIMFTY